jgi:predicted nuclease of restriction endonuclease-like (RecB) superfamily
MRRRGISHGSIAFSTEPLYREVRSVLESARAGAYRAVNSAMVQAYWQVGRLIVEHAQRGRRRAAYGEQVLAELSRRLTGEFGRGFDGANLRKMRLFYGAFAIRAAVRHESVGRVGSAPARPATSGRHTNARRSDLAEPTIRDTVRFDSAARSIAPVGAIDSRESQRPELRPELSWTHYRILLGVEDATARERYMHEAATQHWSTRQLERQISVLYHERMLASRKKSPVRSEARRKLAALAPEQFIRDPYVLDFLDLEDYPGLRELEVEKAINANLQAFLLEMGKGFAFVARQKRVRFEDEDFYIDLVFYNYLLRCFVLIDLKVGKLTHQDIGQMDSYVRVFDAHARPEGDNPTIGLILCSKKNEAIARYSVLNEGRRIFAAKYVKILPTEAELQQRVERERERVEARVGLDTRPRRS